MNCERSYGYRNVHSVVRALAHKMSMSSVIIGMSIKYLQTNTLGALSEACML